MSLQSSYQIGEVIRNAVAFDVKNWPGESMNSDSLIHAVLDLFTILEQRQIEYVLVGGVAVLHYVEGRNTQDLDLLMTLSSLEKLPELKITNQDMYFAHANYGDLQIDILLTRNPLFERVLRNHAKLERFLDHEIPIATVEGLLLLKLYALPSLYRQGNFARVSITENDIATLIYTYHPDEEKLFDELSGYLGESDLKEITNIVVDIQNRIQRFNNENGEND